MGMKLIVLTACSAMLLASCTSHPLGISDAQWAEMSLDQQIEARQQQALLDEKAQQRRHEQQLLQQQQAKEKQDKKDALRRQTQVGDLLECYFDEVELKLGNKWQAGLSQSVELIRHDVEMLHLTPKQSSYQTMALEVSFDGLNIRACSTAYRNDCDQLSATTQQLYKGIAKRIRTKQLKSKLFCQFPVTRKPIYHR